jgi:hypothetical protein
MPSAHGVIHGYNGPAAVDEKRQIIVHAQAFGQGIEAKILTHMIEGIRAAFPRLRPPSERRRCLRRGGAHRRQRLSQRGVGERTTRRWH